MQYTIYVAKKEKSEKELLKEISEKLDKIIALIVMQGKDVDTQIKILRGLKLEWDEIGGQYCIKSWQIRYRVLN